MPLRAPVTVGWVVLGFRVGGILEERLSNLTGLNVSIVPSQQSLRTVLITQEKTLSYSVPFIEGSQNFAVMLRRSLEEAMLPYIEARRGLLIFAGALLLFVAIAGVMLSANIAQPLRTLASAAQKIISEISSSMEPTSSIGNAS